MTVELYTFESADGTIMSYTTYNAKEAREYAEQHGYKVIAEEYEYAGSEVVWDFTKATREDEQ